MVQNMPQKGDDIGKIFVGGLHQATTEEGLQKYFESFGDVADCVLMKDPTTKKSRGFGFITFADPSVIQDVLNKRPHTLDHKQIDPKPAVPRGPGESGPMAGGGGFGGNRSGNNNALKVFVGGIASNTTDDDLKTYFSAYGMVTNVTLMYDKETDRMRGFGFVAFDSKESVEKTAHIHYHQINGKTVEVKKAQSRDQQQRGGPQGMGGPMGGMQGALSQPAQPYGSPYQPGGYGQQPVPGMGRGYGMGGYGQYGAAPGQPPAQPQGYGAVGTPGVAPGAGYGYGGLGAGAMPSGYGATPDATASMYARGPAPGRDVTGYAPTAGYGATGYAGAMPPTSAAPGPAAPATGYPDYGQAAAAAASTAPLQPHAGLGSYQQQDSAYGPSRGPTYATAGESGYSAGGYAGGAADNNYAGAATGYGDQSFGRGAAATRGYHPYGR